MLPIGAEEQEWRYQPITTFLLIATNVLVFFFLQQFGYNQRITYGYSLVPYEFLSGHDLATTSDGRLVDLTTKEISPDTLPFDIKLAPSPHPVYLTLVTSLFLHGSFLHLLGNMLFLWVFGRSIENALGSFRFLIFYLVAGVSASLIHILFNQSGLGVIMPCLGASGAISGVMAAYLMLFPHRYVAVIIFFFVVELPAFIVIGVWFLFQLINALGGLGDPSGGGIAYSAHIGGFLVGLALIVPFSTGREFEEDPYWQLRQQR
jgi:membrane associated rhomboid family serine protease